MSSVTSDSTEIGKPQETINEFWENLITKNPSKVTKIFPPSLYANLLPPKRKSGTITGKNAAESYDAAAAECRARIKRIVRECHRTNEKFTDPDFDISDLDKNTLEGLMYWYKEDATEASTPSTVHRIDWIFDKPRFEVDGFSSSDLVQGQNGDCWFIAAVAMICSVPDLINKVCVDRDEECGVYGFVFYRDGEWIWTVVDDNLFLHSADFDTYGDTHDPTGVKEAKWKKSHQTGSEALYFAKCADENETWLPLLEKAYAKVHGDYDAIAGGWSGEAVEDLTGGVTTKIFTDRVLSKDRLWNELLQVNKNFLFSADSPGTNGTDSDARRGLALNHAYSVLKAVEEEGEDGKKHRLVLIRNPWGSRANASMGEWTGPWSDGSAEWTPYWMKKLDHKFGDDGLFWMSYEDVLKRFDLLDRTRFFDKEWTVVQRWTSVSVAWVTGYLKTKFVVEIKKAGPTIFVLNQLDDRYFCGLEGKYSFDLHFILQKENSEAGDYIVRARGAWSGVRSISAEIDLEAGIYEVIPKIQASRGAEGPDVQELVAKVADRNPQKLRQIGLNYDIANAKGVIELSEEEKKKKEQKKKEAADKKKKEKEEKEKEKAEFEAWKKDEKAEYDAWKKEKKALEEKEKAKDATSKDKAKDESSKDGAKDEAAKEASKDESAKDVPKKETDTKDEPKKDEGVSSADVSKDPVKPVVVVDLTIKAKDPESKEPTTEPSSTEKAAESAARIEDSDKKESPSKPEEGDAPQASGPPPPSGAPGSTYGDADADADADVPPPPPPPPVEPKVDDTPKPWNAVCVLGLRVYSKDSEVSIKLVKPKDAEEASLLDVDGTTAAGATM